jgi:hypothetical protein
MVPKTRPPLASPPVPRLLKVLALLTFLGAASAVLGMSCTDNSGNGHYNPDGAADGGGGTGGAGGAAGSSGGAGGTESDGAVDQAGDSL